MPKNLSFSSVFTNAFTAYKARLQSVVIGAVIFGVIFGFLVHGLEKMGHKHKQMEFMGGMPMDRLEELQERIEEGDERAMEEFLIEMEKMAERQDGMDEAEQAALASDIAMKTATKYLPKMFLLLLLMTVVTVLNTTYFFALAVRKKTDAKAAFMYGASKALPMIGLGIWIFLRSYAWVFPIAVGVLFLVFQSAPALAGLLSVAVYIAAVWSMSRFWSAQVILMGSKKGVMESAHEGLKATGQYAWRFLGYMVLLSILAFIAIVIVGIFFSLVHLPLLGQIANQVIVAYFYFFMVALYTACSGKKVEVA